MKDSKNRAYETSNRTLQAKIDKEIKIIIAGFDIIENGKIILCVSQVTIGGAPTGKWFVHKPGEEQKAWDKKLEFLSMEAAVSYALNVEV